MSCLSKPPHGFGYSLSDQVSRRLYGRWQREGAQVFIHSPRKLGEFEDIGLEQLLAYSVEWGRSDFRLLEILLDWLWKHWRVVHPGKLNAVIRSMPTPGAWGVLYEWTCLRANEMSDSQRAFWVIVLEGIRPENFRFFYTEGKLRTYSESKAELARTRSIYKRWGFVGSALPSVSSWKRATKMSLDKKERMRILRALARAKEQFQLKDYLKALGPAVPRQSAWRDLRDADFLQRRGMTKAAIYRMKI